MMNRRSFLRTTAGVTSLAPAALGAWVGAAPVHAAAPRRVHSRQVAATNIRDYLALEARRITDGALRDFPSAAAWRRLEEAKRRQWLEMMGLDDLLPQAQRPPLNVTVTGVVERPAYRIEKLYFESLPKLYVTANLYVPNGLTGRAPGVLYVCGHARNQKVHYQAHPRRFAELGLVCLIVETIQLGEAEGFHHGCYREGWWHWYSRGYTPAGIELLNGVRALDLLAARPEVAPAKLGVTGISGGGAASWWIAAGDPRVQVAAPVCGTATLFSHVHDRTVDGHCDCMWWINSCQWDLADVGALIAPRPLLIASADKDGIFTIESIRQVHSQLAGLYRKLGAAKNLRLVETPGGHSYHARSRTEIFSWFLKHLAGRDVAPVRVGDIDDRPEKQESLETLRVFMSGSPPGNRTLTIHDDLRPAPKPPLIADAAALERTRTALIRELKRLTFAAFPAQPPPLDLQLEFEQEDDGTTGGRYGFTSEAGWRLHASLWRRKSLAAPAPAVLGLRSPGEGRWDTRAFLGGISVPWVRLEFEARGVGDTAWGEDLNWHVRRAAAWTGRTIASMRVWDTLRALEAVRRLPEIEPARVSLAARGEMGVVALCAALLDGRVRTLFLENPPATLDAPSQKDGRGPALELLHCLRFTDLAQVAGLLWPLELVLVGPIPTTYDWADELYRHLGAPGRLVRVPNLAEWKPA